MKNNAYIKYMVKAIDKYFKGKRRFKSMGTSELIKQELDKRDVENANEAQLAALKFVENETPLPRWLSEKVLKRCEKYGFRYGEVVGAIATSAVTAAEYSKSATRQSVAEKTQIKNFVKNGLAVEKIPSTGQRAMRLLDTGELVFGSLHPTAVSTKAIDGRYGNDLLFQKFTDEFGGAQDNQGRDVLTYLKAANKYVNINKNKFRFVAILDGNFYQANWEKYRQYINGKVLVETSDSYIAKCKSGTRKKASRTTKRVEKTATV